MRSNPNAKLIENAVNIRKHVIRISGKANVSHVGSALSSVDIICALYFGLMKIDPKKPYWNLRDRFVLSKGHGGAALYAALSERGYFSKKTLNKFCFDGSSLPTHPVIGCVSGVEATTGSLGHGLPIGIGMALAGKNDKKSYKTYVLMSDGECDEGSVWEAILFAGHHKLDNLIAIVDYNKIQSFGRTKKVLDLEPFSDKLRAFRWCVKEIDGHNFDDIRKAVIHSLKHKEKPHFIIAHTIKGKGVSFMENKLEWHYRSPTGDLMSKALAELDKNEI